MSYNEKEVIVFTVLIKYFQYFHLFPQHGSSFNFKLYLKFNIPLIILGIPLLFGMCGYLYQAHLGKNFDAVVYNTYYLSFTFMSLSVTVFNFLNGNKYLIPLFKMLSKVINDYQREYREEIIFINKFTKILFYGSCLITLCISLDSYSKDDRFCNEDQLVNDQHYVCGLIAALWYPFEISKKMTPLLAVCNLAVCWYFMPMISGSIAYYLVCRLVIVRIEHVIKLLKQLEFQGVAEETESKMRQCVENYVEITRIVRQINASIGVILAPAHNAINQFLIGSCGYLIIRFHSPTNVLPLLMWIFVQWLACYYGQQLEDANQKLQDELYNLPWYNMNPSLRSSFKIFQIQISQPLYLKIQPLHTLNMLHFSELIQGTYTFLMFLLRI